MAASRLRTFSWRVDNPFPFRALLREQQLLPLVQLRQHRGVHPQLLPKAKPGLFGAVQADELWS